MNRTSTIGFSELHAGFSLASAAKGFAAKMVNLVAVLAVGFAACTPTVSDQPPSAPPVQSAELARAPDVSGPASVDPQALQIQDFSAREESGQTSLLLKLSKPVSQFRHFPLTQPSRIILDIFGGAVVPADMTSFRVGSNLVGTVRFSAGQDSLRVSIDVITANVPVYSVVPDAGGLRIVVGNANPTITTSRDFALVRGGKRMDNVAAQAGIASPGGRESSSASGTLVDQKKYTGQKLSFDFKDADIKNIFRLLAEVSGLNIVVTADVNRRVTLRLVEVPWDQAMDLLIDTNGLGKEQIGNVVRISTAGQLKAERDALVAARKSEENYEPLHTVYFNVNYAMVKDLEPKIRMVLSKRPDAALVVDDRSNMLMIRDVKQAIDDASVLVAKLDNRTPQVLIESNLIETTPTFSRSLGIEMESLFNDGRVRTSGRFMANPPFSGGVQPPPAVNQLAIPTSGFRFGYFGNNITSVLSAAEQEGNVRIISRPSVVTLNNVESQIESANILRVRTSAATVGEAGNIREIRAGITLKVTPQVSADGFVLLKIHAKSSTLDFGRTVDGIPQENTREANANLLVKDGETVVIGGIMKDSSSNSDSGVPYLKDVPVLGWLFKKASWQKDLEELVIFITPRIVAVGSENLPMAEQIWRDQMKQTEGTGSHNSSPRP